MDCFDSKELECLNSLSAFCFKTSRHLSNQLIIRYATYHNFNYKKTKNAIAKGSSSRSLYLEMEGELMRFFMQSMVVFPLPGLLSRKSGCEVFYVRPSRCTPPFDHLYLDSLCYVLNDMSKNAVQCRNGVLMLINMEDYTMKNFQLATQTKLSEILEGHVIPTRVVNIVIVNPPKILKRIWKMLKPTFSSTFKKKIHILNKNEKLGDYLMDGYQEYLPDEFLGWKSTKEMAIDYCDMKRHEERQRQSRPEETNGATLDETFDISDTYISI